MNIEIRKMIPDDLPQALELLKKWNMAPIQPSEDNPDPERRSILIENSFVALDEGRLAGICSYIVLSETSAETASLAVNPGCLGLGVGYALQEARLNEMRDRGIAEVFTETDRPETINWYIEKFGYTKIGSHKKKHAFSLETEDAWTVLKLELR
jgi:N-acetylglutamate synthase-like GNAT family acetyltransferase